MNSSTITVHWHDDTQPVYTVAFQPVGRVEESPRLVTGGGDNNVRVWKLVQNDNGYTVEYLSSLRKHTQAVNVVKFNSTGTVLASAGDDGTLILWTLSPTIVKDFESEDDEDIKESWVVSAVFRSSTSEIYDIAWSPDDKYIASGSMDNLTRIYNVETKQLIHQISSHSHYVQGIAWDPRGEFLASQSADRSLDIYQLSAATAEPKLLHKISKLDAPAVKLSKSPKEIKTRNIQMFYSETLQSFFRRLTFSPDGKFLLAPAGIYKTHDGETEEETNTVFIFTRGSFFKAPVAHLPGMKKPSIAISFAPIVYKSGSTSSALGLPYKMIFAVATQDAIVIYDTDAIKPLGYVTNLHYSNITDLTWNKDGRTIIISSADGFCSNVHFDDVFGEVLTWEGDISFWQKLSDGESVDNTIVVPDSETVDKAETAAIDPTHKQGQGGIVGLLKRKD